MTDVCTPQRGALAGVRLVDRPEALSAIHDADCAAAIWQRRPQATFLDWIDALAVERLPTERIVVRPEAVRETLVGICETAGTPNCEECAWLIDDAATLATLFAGLMRASYLRLRLDVVTTNACRKFHIDAVMARLVCTFRGTGTQYGNAWNGEDLPQVSTVPTGAPIVLRGAHWPTSPLSRLKHRSPPIEGSGQSRLVLVLDPISEPEP